LGKTILETYFEEKVYEGVDYIQLAMWTMTTQVP